MTDEPEIDADIRAQAVEATGLPNVPKILDMNLELSRDEKLRMSALMMAVSYHKDTIVRDSQMYQTMKLNGANFRATDSKQVLDAALVFEGYLRGHYNEMMVEITLGVQHAIDDVFQNMPDTDPAG
jgi:hypothetical protein